jgi:hypothetical protein
MTLHFNRQPLTREVARGLRAATRKVPALDGHRFIYTDLKELWATEDGIHLVLTHDSDPVYQYWYRPPEGTMELVCCTSTRQEAQAAAEAKAVPLPPTPSGHYVLAWRPGGRTIRVACKSKDPSVMRGIFERLGYETNVEEIV